MCMKDYGSSSVINHMDDTRQEFGLETTEPEQSIKNRFSDKTN